MTKRPEDVVRSILDSYPALNRPDTTYEVCSFAVFDDEEALVHLCRAVCHAHLHYQSDKIARKSARVLTSFPVVDGSDLDFFYYLKNGLFERWSDCFHLKYLDDDPRPYIEINNLDLIPSKALFSFCICSRMIVEYRTYLARWHELRKTMPDGVAHVLSRFNIARRVDEVPWFQNHWPFDHSLDFNRVLNAAPKVDDRKDYRNFPTDCTPVNMIWGHSRQIASLQGKTVHQFWDEFKQEAHIG